jgi:PBSX family phage terminase large subunit
MNSIPSLAEFDPKLIPFQYKVLRDIRLGYDYTKGKHEVLLSGSIGSAKSILMAHIIVTHCLLNPGARVMIGRKVMKDLKDTLIQMIQDHIDETLVEGRDYQFSKVSQKWRFSNDSEIISRSWDNKNFKQFRSLALSGIAIEELTESDDKYKGFYFEAIQRVGRLPHVKENFVIAATNPDSPTHWAYKHFILKPTANRHVYYSKTADNPFLPPTYIEQLRENLDPKMALRMLEGQWTEIDEERVYYNYDRARNFINEKLEINPAFPIDISHDFNIGEGKPMSATVSQYIDGIFHFKKVYAIHGARTNDILDEMADDGLFEHTNKFRIFGDASGKARDTRSIKSDYDIIRQFVANYQRKDGTKLDFEMLVPLSNPPVRSRHNLVNSSFLDANGHIKLYVYNEAEMLDEGFRLTKLKKGGNYIEDDSIASQHCTTAAGYMIHYLRNRIKPPSRSYVR